MKLYKKIEFYEASTLVSFIKENSEKIISNRLLGIYSVSSENWYGSQQTYVTDEPIIFEFESFVVQVEYYYHSVLNLKIVDRDSFLQGELTRYLCGYVEMRMNPQPFKKIESSYLIENEFIQGIDIGRFSQEYCIDSSSDSVRPMGGDYFGFISLNFFNVGYKVIVNAQSAEADGFMEYRLVDMDFSLSSLYDIDCLQTEKVFMHDVIEVDDKTPWNFCVVGNIVKTRTDEMGIPRHGTSAFSGGTKVYIQGKFWNDYYKERGLVSVIGLSRGKKYESHEVPVDAIENVRFQRVFDPKVVSMMDHYEYSQAWWHRTADDRREAKAFAEEWNNKYGK